MSGSASGRHCTDPVTCEFFDRCNPPRPSDHIGYLPRIDSRTAVFPPVHCRVLATTEQRDAILYSKENAGSLWR